MYLLFQISIPPYAIYSTNKTNNHIVKFNHLSLFHYEIRFFSRRFFENGLQYWRRITHFNILLSNGLGIFMKRGLLLLVVALLFVVGCTNEAVEQQDKLETTEEIEKESTKVEDDEKENTEEDQEEISVKESSSKSDASLDPLTVHYIDAGQGDAALLQFTDDDDTYTILYDSGDWQGDEVVPYLQQENVDFIDIVMISHPHADHIGQLENVLQHFDVGEVWMSENTANSSVYERAAEAILESDADYEEPKAGDVFDIGELTIQIPHPDTLTGDLNEDSLSAHFSYGETAFLFTGDAYIKQEQEMIDRDMDIEAEFLQLGHHGSDTSTSQTFLDAVKPTYAIYSAGEGNTYGHPHQEVLDRLNSNDITTYGTDVHGTIVVETDGIESEINTEKDGKVAAGKKEADEQDSESTSTSSNSTTSHSNSVEKETTSDDCVDINHATKDELQEIIHIGEERAEDIIDLRPFDSVKDLERVDGIGPARLDDILDEDYACTGG